MEIITEQNIILVGNGQIFAQAQQKTTSPTSNYRPVTQYCKRTRGINESSTQQISKVECNQWPEQRGLMLKSTTETSNEAVSTSGCRFIHGCGRTISSSGVSSSLSCDLLDDSECRPVGVFRHAAAALCIYATRIINNPNNFAAQSAAALRLAVVLRLRVRYDMHCSKPPATALTDATGLRTH